jgi:hypothetical protein
VVDEERKEIMKGIETFSKPGGKRMSSIHKKANAASLKRAKKKRNNIRKKGKK